VFDNYYKITKLYSNLVEPAKDIVEEVLRDQAKKYLSK